MSGKERPDLLEDLCDVIDEFERKYNVWVEGKEFLLITER